MKRRTTASGGEPAERVHQRAGNAGYAGYEYQITVSVWVGLDLMLVKGLANQITIEPRSDEDLEAAVANPETGLLETAAAGDGFDLVLQAKTRSGAPWTAPAIADVLLGKGNDAAGKDGKRSRPLEMLEADERRRYVFVTNEASVEALRAHEGDHLFDFAEPTDLPPHARDEREPAVRKGLAERVLLLTGLTEEVLSGRISTQLEQHGHVPQARRADCMRELRDLVRERICGVHGGIWTRDELLTVLVKHGGSIAPTRDMDHYVRPASYESIRRKLENEHAVVIAGPSGTGKTLTADILELELRAGVPAFEVVGEEHGPGPVRRSLSDGRSLLFHLRDPWGGNRLMPGADRWSGELPKLLELAGAGKKFLVTSRSDVLESAGTQLSRELAPYVEWIRPEDYSPAQLAEIYDRLASDLGDHAGMLATTYRVDALAHLKRPYEIRRFLSALARESASAPSKVADLIARSQIAAISSVIADQLAPFGIDGVQSAAIIWSMLVARGAVPDKVLALLTRRLRGSDTSFRPDVQGLVDFLVAGDNLKRGGAALSFAHPRVEDGLRMAFMRRSDDAADTLRAVVDQLIAWDEMDRDWGREAALAIVKRTAGIDGLDVTPSDDKRASFDDYLLTLVMDARGHSDVGSAFGDLARFGSSGHLPSQLARHLVGGARRPRRPSFGPHWRAPELIDEERSRLAADPATRELAERFVLEVLPHSHDDYDRELVPFLEALAPDLRAVFWRALDAGAHAGATSNNLDVIVEGALFGGSPDYERAIGLFARAEEEADAWMERYAKDLREAEEHEIDADSVDHVLGEPEDQYHVGRSGMQSVVRIRRNREGSVFLVGHRHAQLLVRALAYELTHSREPVEAAELQLTLDVSEGWTRHDVWRAIAAHWDSSLLPELEAEFSRGDDGDDDIRRTLIEILSRDILKTGLVQALSDIAPSCSAERRLELLRNFVAEGLEGDPRGDEGVAARGVRAAALAATFPQEERELAIAFAKVVAGGEIGAAAAELSQPSRDHLELVLTSAPSHVAGPLALIGAAAGIDVRAGSDALLATDEPDDGLVALQAMALQDPPDRQARLLAALDHGRYHVRSRALGMLVPVVTDTEERRAIAAKSASDRSADVRLAFAEAMAEHRWPEALEPLCTLLGDLRDFSHHLSSAARGSNLLVARAATSALGAYDDLPVAAIDALLAAAGAPSKDPLVPCRALAALACVDDPRVDGALTGALSAPAPRQSPAHRPLAQAAAWAIRDRVIDGKMATLGPAADFARTQRGTIAGPLLMSAGLLGGTERKSLLDQLERDGDVERRELVVVAAAAAGRTDGLQIGDRERLIGKVVARGSTAGLDPSSLGELETWSRSLDVGGEFSRYAAWVAHDLLELPLSADLGDVRGPDLPSLLPVMTMRSFTPYREEPGSNAQRQLKPVRR
ncbi:HEAT repeat domain-containing protein [Sphingomonas albertensis]|uniref:Novel STAND NTPase 3 domain-containing protein n=1 Tax=Sphingomonas albertensis TaxID=2762591 RepID=A0ABR7AJK5_9SPHN|nr:hypothetical protein [Sphingomonas albertensis]MBC3940635.1 hypothetical protein [Sphingomonas albertensis]